MKKLVLAFLGLAALSMPAHAQVVTLDMSKVTCGDYSGLDADTSIYFSAWMSGFFNQRAGSTAINLEGYRKNVASVESWCQRNPNANLMSALQASVASAKAGSGGATEINVGNISCGDFVASDVDFRTLIASWTGGWFMSTKNLTVVDPRYVKRNTKVTIEYCEKHKSESLMSAIEKHWK